MIPLIIAGAVLAAALAERREDDGDEEEEGSDLGLGNSPGLYPDQPALDAGQLDFGFPRERRSWREEVPDTANPRKLSLRYLLELVSDEPLYATVADNEYLISASDDKEEILVEFKKNKGKEGWENISVLEYKSVPIPLFDNLIRWLSPDRGTKSVDGAEVLGDLEASLSTGATFDVLVDFDMRRDLPFRSWHENAKEDEREFHLQDFIGDDIEEGTVLWFKTRHPEAWRPYLGASAPRRLFGGGLIAVTDGMHLDAFDTRAGAPSDRGGQHAVKLIVKNTIGLAGGVYEVKKRSRRYGGPFSLDELLETNLDLESIDVEDVLNKLHDNGDKLPLVIHLDDDGGELVFAPIVDDDDFEVAEVVAL